MEKVMSESTKKKLIKWGWINHNGQPLYLRHDDKTGNPYFSIYPKK